MSNEAGNFPPVLSPPVIRWWRRSVVKLFPPDLDQPSSRARVNDRGRRRCCGIIRPGNYVPRLGWTVRGGGWFVAASSTTMILRKYCIGNYWSRKFEKEGKELVERSLGGINLRESWICKLWITSSMIGMNLKVGMEEARIIENRIRELWKLEREGVWDWWFEVGYWFEASEINLVEIDNGVNRWDCDRWWVFMIKGENSKWICWKIE